MKISNNLLEGDSGDDVSLHMSPNQSAGIQPLYLIMHYTAGPTLDGAVSWLAQSEAQASAHLVIGRDGKVVQMVPFNKRAWHAGKSSWGNLDGMNQYSLGIELV